MCVRVRACMCGVGKEGETERESGERDLCNQMIGGGGGAVEFNLCKTLRKGRTLKGKFYFSNKERYENRLLVLA